MKHPRAIAAIALTAAALLASCSTPAPVQPSISASQTGPIQRGSYARVPTTDEQRGTCDGVPEPTALDRVVAQVHITKVVVCLPDQEITMVGKEGLQQDTIDQLVRRWGIPDKPASISPCALPAATLVGIVLVDSAGQKWRPAIPKDECGRPEAAADEAIGAILQNASFMDMQSASASPSP